MCRLRLCCRWTASSEFGTYRLCEQQRFRRACASAQSRQNLRYSLIQAVSQEEPSDRKPDPWPLWMAGHAQSKFVMTECSKTQICLTRPRYCHCWHCNISKSFFYGRIPDESGYFMDDAVSWKVITHRLTMYYIRQFLYDIVNVSLRFSHCYFTKYIG